MEKRKFSIKEMFSKRSGKKNSKQDINVSNDSFNDNRENDMIGRIYIRVTINIRLNNIYIYLN